MIDLSRLPLIPCLERFPRRCSGRARLLPSRGERLGRSLALPIRYANPGTALARGLLLIVPILAALTLLSRSGQGEVPAGPPKPFQAPPTEFECRWTESPITLDGKADEVAWKQA